LAIFRVHLNQHSRISTQRLYQASKRLPSPSQKAFTRSLPPRFELFWLHGPAAYAAYKKGQVFHLGLIIDQHA